MAMKRNKLILTAITALLILSGGCFSPKGDFDMNVTLEMSAADVLTILSDNCTDSIFLAALGRAGELHKNTESDFISLFGESFREVDPNARMAAIFATIELKDRISFNSTNEEVLEVIRNEANNAYKQSVEVLRKRLRGYGIPEKSTVIEVEGNKIHLKLAGVENPERIKELMTESCNLGFWETYENEEILSYLVRVNDFLKTSQPGVPEKPAEKEPVKAEGEQSLLDIVSDDISDNSDSLALDKFIRDNPLFGMLRPNVNSDGQPMQGSLAGFASLKDTSWINNCLEMPEVIAIFPRDIKFIWSRDPYRYDESQTYYELHAIKITTRDGQPPVDGSVITSAEAATGSGDSDIRIQFAMNAEGAKIWQRMTRDNIDRNIAVVINGYVISSPRVMSEISGGKTEISGNFTIEEASDLANIFNAGELPVNLKIIQEQITKVR